MPELNPLHPSLQQALSPWRTSPRWTVAFSGGLDSTVLLDLLRTCRDRDNPGTTLRVLHVNHGLQESADDWQRHGEALCADRGLDFSAHRVRVATGEASPERAARRARYAVFERELGEGEPLFLAHHLDDQVETFFLRLLRGSGLRGLAAMPARRPLGRGELVRPLLEFPRGQLEAYARSRDLHWVEDPTNAAVDADRNYLRHQVLPRLAARWPAYRSSVGGASRRLDQAGALLEQLLPPLDRLRSVMGDEGLALSDLLPADSGPLQLQRWLKALGLPAPDSRQQEEFLRQLRRGDASSGQRLDCGSYVLRRYRQGVYRVPAPVAGEASSGELLAPGKTLTLPDGTRLSLVSATGQGLRLAPGEHLQLSYRTGGERCQPAGREGSRSLKKLLQDQAVPPWWRNRIPLLSLQGELLAVADLCLCQSSRLAESAGPGEGLWRPRWERI